MANETTKNQTKNNRPILWIFIAFILGFTLPVCSCLGMGTVTMWQFGKLAEVSAPDLGLGTGDAVAIIDLNGAITSSSQDYLSLQGITPDGVDALLEQAAADASIKAVVVRVNSPGGSVVASDEIYHSLLDFQKPIVISMSDTAASGGYYIACGGDYVIAHPDTLTGSIGVISQFFVIEDLMEKYGVEAETITSGPNKGIGSSFHKMTDEERAIMESIVNQVYEDFIAVVSKARDMPLDEVREIADGSIYTGRQALELGLVDTVGIQDDAIAKAAELGGITGEPRIVKLSPTPSFMDMFLTYQASQSLSLREIIDFAQTPLLLFR